MLPKKTVKFIEYEEKKKSDLDFSSHEINSLDEKYFDIKHKAIKAKQFVGVYSFAKCQIEVWPKLLRGNKNKEDENLMIKNLMNMIFYAKNLSLIDSKDGALSSSTSKFIHGYIKIFVTKLAKALERGVPRRYVLNEENLKAVRGKIVIGENIKRNFILKNRIFCRYDDFSENNKVNQTLKFVTEKILLPLVRDDCFIRGKIEQCFGLFE